MSVLDLCGSSFDPPSAISILQSSSSWRSATLFHIFWLFYSLLLLPPLLSFSPSSSSSSSSSVFISFFMQSPLSFSLLFAELPSLPTHGFCKKDFAVISFCFCFTLFLFYSPRPPVSFRLGPWIISPESLSIRILASPRLSSRIESLFIVVHPRKSFFTIVHPRESLFIFANPCS